MNRISYDMTSLQLLAAETAGGGEIRLARPRPGASLAWVGTLLTEPDLSTLPGPTTLLDVTSPDIPVVRQGIPGTRGTYPQQRRRIVPSILDEHRPEGDRPPIQASTHQ